MYRVRPDLTKPPIALDQGDILTSVPRPSLPTAKNISFVANRKNIEWPRPQGALASRSPHLRVIVPIEWLDFALVVSNSCDNVAAQAIEIAPIRAFKFRADDDAERWREISHAATSTASPKLLYLPGDNDLGFSRAEAFLGEKFPVSFDYIIHCATEAGTTRLCGLTKDGQVHLQWQLGVAYGRNDREDLDWPSHDDLKLKRVWLKRELADPKRKTLHERYRQDLAAIDAVLVSSDGNGHPIESDRPPELIDAQPARSTSASPSATAAVERATEADDPSEGSKGS